MNILKYIWVWILVSTSYISLAQNATFFDDSQQSGYYDSGLAFKGGGSSLAQAGPSEDKIPTTSSEAYAGANALQLTWTSVNGGNWDALIIAPGFPFQNISNADYLSMWVFSPDGIVSADLPDLYFEGAPGTTKSTRFPLGNFSNDIPANSWTQILVPLDTYFDDPNQTSIQFNQVKAVILGQNQADSVAHTMLVDEVKTLTEAQVNDPVQAPSGLMAVGYEQHIELAWSLEEDPARVTYHLYRSEDGGQNFSLRRSISPTDSLYIDWIGPDDNVSYQYQLVAVNGGGTESNPTSSVSGQTHTMTDDEWLDMVQRYTFRYFWDFSHPISGLARERNTSDETVTIGGSGFGVMAILIGIERGFITYEEGRDRVMKIATFLDTADRFHGAWPHWMNGTTGKIISFSQYDDGGDLVETSFMVQGLLTARQYFDQPGDSTLRNLLTELWEDVEWNWYRKQVQRVLYWHWSPNFGWQINFELRGHNETHIAYLLAIASPTHGIPASLYHDGWAGGNYTNGNTYYGWPLPLGSDYGGPLFFAHYSYLGFDPRNKRDDYAHYFVQNRNHTLINRAWCIDNPQGHLGYGPQVWGLTASDNPFGYLAQEPGGNRDNGTITPTAALGSMPYTPENSMATMKNFYRSYGERLWGPMGFYDAFNLTEDWFATSYLAIDQGPIIIMLENYRTGLLWDNFMANPEIQPMMDAIGMTIDSTATSVSGASIPGIRIFPNPVQGEIFVEWPHQHPTELKWEIMSLSGKVALSGQSPYTPSGLYPISTQDLPSGIYLLQVQGKDQVHRQKIFVHSNP